MLPYGRQSISAEDIEAVTAVLRGDWLTTGPAVAAFEAAVSELTGGHRAVSCTSGTAALHMAYAALGVGPGDEVVTTPMTFVATASCAAILGAKVVFADVEDGHRADRPGGRRGGRRPTGPRSSRRSTTPASPRTTRRCSRSRIGSARATLDDAAHSVGGFADGRPVGDLADVTTLSFFPTKNLTTGEGGAVVCKDPAVAQRAHEFHFIGLVRDPARFEIADEGPWHQEVHEFGVNYRLTDLACGARACRSCAGSRRSSDVGPRSPRGTTRPSPSVDGLRTPVQRAGVDPAWHLYPVRVLGGRRREVFEGMRAAGIGVQVNYIPVYWHPVFARQGYQRGLCPNAEQFYRRGALPARCTRTSPTTTSTG